MIYHRFTSYLYDRSKLMLLAILWLGGSAVADHRAYFPHFTFRDNLWQTQLVLTNTTFLNTDVRLRAYSDEGDLVGETSFRLGAAASKVADVQDYFGSMTVDRGWVEVVSEPGRVEGVVVFGNTATGGTTSLPMETQADQGLLFSFVPHDADRESGIVLMNPDDRFATVVFVMVDMATEQRQVRVRTLAPRSRMVTMIEDLYEMTPPAHARLEVKSSRDVVGFGLTFHEGAKQIVAVPAKPWRITDKQASIEMDWKAVLGDTPIGGAALAVHRGGQPELAAAAGLADMFTGEAFTTEHASSIGSITKTFVATLAMMHVEEGRLSLDQTLDTWVPEVPHADRITVEMMLNHSSGIAEYGTQPYVGALLERDFEDVWDPRELLAFALAEPPVFEPGTQYSYSNTNFLLLGMILEQVGGQPLAAQLRARIIDPLDMTQTYLRGFEEPVQPHARGFIWDPQNLLGLGEIVDTHNMVHGSSSFADGGMVSTPSDLNRFIRALVGGELLREETLARMLTPSKHSPFYALGITLNDDGAPDEATVGHDGAFVYGVANMVYFQDYDLALSVTLDVYPLDDQYLIHVLSSAMSLGKVMALMP
ncbi:Beta-lactamase family protein [Sulfidibacter corallicola]|uniref:Beta-lactamase family protein n=1 Tax=Sulfidibacter corallicola TaxID=2818388 RepID=A0A8A4TK37_SULCO|nr:serine hydrolase domain-containing protein [Sulfidibacter corallicola]QTD49564.1 beta-lactamase family protein [Sulfidibacter corallicola]